MSENKKNKNKSSNAISGSLKDTEKRRRQVFKPILDNPYTQTKLWPYISPELSNTILEHLSQILSNLGSYNGLVAEAKKNNNSKMKTTDIPEIRKEITIGFNSTIKALETQASRHRQILTNKSKKHKKQRISDPSPYIKYVFVAKYDITSSLLTNPFPVLAFTSSTSVNDRVKLIQLPRGSMSRLSSILKIENASILGLSDNIEQAQALYELIKAEVKDVEAPWLDHLFSENDLQVPGVFRKPAVKFLSTSAPIMAKKNDQKAKNKSKKEKEPAELKDTNNENKSK